MESGKISLRAYPSLFPSLPPPPQLVQIKADLHDVLYSHKWTPDAYIMARAYVSDERSWKEKEG